MKVESHPDGEWMTSRYEYLDTEIVIKSREDKGMKAHCFHNGKVIFSQNFKWIKPNYLLTRMKNRIDLWKCGDWTPKKLRN